MAIRLPRPPQHQDPIQWGIWFDAVYKALSGIVGVVWDAIDKTGSRLSEIETRPHSDLQTIEQADDTSSDTTGNRHISDAQAKAWTAKLDTVAVDGVTIVGEGTVESPLMSMGSGGNIDGGSASSTYQLAIADGGGA